MGGSPAGSETVLETDAQREILATRVDSWQETGVEGRWKGEESGIFREGGVQCEMRFIRNAQQNASQGRAWLLPGGLQRARGPRDVAAALGRESCENDAANGGDTSRRGAGKG
jgi:hypothetical protein